jgi:protein TonB
MLDNQLQAPSKIPKEIKQIKESAAPPSMAGVAGMEGMGGGTAGGVMGGILGGIGSGPTVKAAPPKKLSISSGVMAGNLLEKTIPQYPAIAKAARIQGTVVLQATISKNGTIQNLRVVSGPPMLQQAALDAVRSWRYKPYLLNGDPVEVETTVNVVFNLGG